MAESAQAWVTLATNDSYALGALVLARSLRRVNTGKQLAVMITPGVSGPMRGVLSEAFDVVNEVNILDSQDAANLALLARPELGITFTKIHCWKLTQFSKCVFLDADTLVIQNCDELFDREELSAAPDAGWPDCFNSGVFVFKPSEETYTRINNFALSHGSFDGGDQGLLNMFFSDWSQSDASRRLPFIYNMCSSATYSYLPAYKVFGQSVKITHFIGQTKPWLVFFDSATGLVRPPPGQDHLQELLQAWWNIFRSDVHPRLSPEMGGGDQSATMVEQVQASFSQIFISAEPSASSQFAFHQSHDESHQLYSEPSQHYDNPPNDQPHPPPEPILLVAIKRYPPEHFWTPPPPTPHVEYHPPPPPPVSSPESSDWESRHAAQSSNAQTTFAGSSGSSQGNNRGSHSNDGSRNSNQQSNQNSRPFTQEKVRKKKRSKSKGIAGVYAKVTLEGQGNSGEQLECLDHMRKSAWEHGQMDYMGKDSFDNIMKRIQQSMAQTSVQKPKAKSPTPQRRQTPPKEEEPIVPPEQPVPEPTPVEESIVVLTSDSQVPETEADTSTQSEPPKAESTPVTETVSKTSAATPVLETVPQPTVTVPVTQTVPVVASVPEPVGASGSPPKSAEEERSEFEKKISEQKRVAEQKLEEEKAAAAARIAAAAAVLSASKPEEPKAPPRKETGLGNTNVMQYGVGLGLLGAAVVLVFAIYAAYSPTSFFL